MISDLPNVDFNMYAAELIDSDTEASDWKSIADKSRYTGISQDGDGNSSGKRLVRDKIRLSWMRSWLAPIMDLLIASKGHQSDIQASKHALKTRSESPGSQSKYQTCFELVRHSTQKSFWLMRRVYLGGLVLLCAKR